MDNPVDQNLLVVQPFFPSKPASKIGGSSKFQMPAFQQQLTSLRLPRRLVTKWNCKLTNLWDRKMPNLSLQSQLHFCSKLSWHINNLYQLSSHNSIYCSRYYSSLLLLLSHSFELVGHIGTTVKSSGHWRCTCQVAVLYEKTLLTLYLNSLFRSF